MSFSSVSKTIYVHIYITRIKSDFILFYSSAHADKHGYGVVQQFVGHGVGRLFHSDPVILHYSKFLAFLIQMYVVFFDFILVFV